MVKQNRPPTITSAAGHIRSYSFRPFLALILTASLLSFFGGFINAICLGGFFEIAISAATGTTSKMNIALANGDFTAALHFFLVLFSFVLGSSISAALVGRSSFRIQRPYGLALLLESFALAVGYLSEKATFTLMESSVRLQVGAYFISLACGLQNGMCTTFSGAVIRTTHVTGTLTDIGLILGEAIFHARTRKHVWKLKILLPLYITFCLGGIIGWSVYKIWSIHALLVPCTIVGLCGIIHLCYCKIFLMYRKKPIHNRYWRRNKKNRTRNPTIGIDGNTNNSVDKHHNKKQQNEREENSTNKEPVDLHIVFVHDTKTDITVS